MALPHFRADQNKTEYGNISDRGHKSASTLIRLGYTKVSNARLKVLRDA
jgi:hypothetical protein